MPSSNRPGQSRFHYRIDAELMADLRLIANARGTSLKSVLDDLVRSHIAREVANRSDQAMAPVIDSLLQERIQNLETGLRSMIARVAYEVLRTQYVLYNFLSTAGVPEAKVEMWRHQGWRFATKEFKRQAGDGATEESDESRRS